MGFLTRRWHGSDLDCSCLAELELELVRNRFCDLPLDREDVLQIPFVRLRPKVLIPLSVDELGRDQNTRAVAANASLEHVGHGERICDLADREALSLEREGGRAPRHSEVRELRQRVKDFLGNAVGEVLVVGIPAHVEEREDRDARFFRRGLPSGARRVARVVRGTKHRDEETGHDKNAGDDDQLRTAHPLPALLAVVPGQHEGDHEPD